MLFFWMLQLLYRRNKLSAIVNVVSQRFELRENCVVVEARVRVLLLLSTPSTISLVNVYV